MDPAVTVTKQPTASRSPSAAPSSRSGEQVTVRTDRRAGRSRVEVRKLDLWSVLKVSLCFYLAGLAVVVVAGIVAWLLIDAAGGIHNFEKFMGDIMSAKDYRIIGSQLLIGSVLVGLVLVALWTILTVLAAALFNVFSELVGGIELTLVDTE